MPAKQKQLTALTALTAPTTEGGPIVIVEQKLFSAPVHKADKEFLLNECLRTGLSQKDIIKAAIEALSKSPLPNAMPIKL